MTVVTFLSYDFQFYLNNNKSNTKESGIMVSIEEKITTTRKRQRYERKFVLKRIVNVKVDDHTFLKLRELQEKAGKQIKHGKRSRDDYYSLADELRDSVKDYLNKLEAWLYNEESMTENKEDF